MDFCFYCKAKEHDINACPKIVCRRCHRKGHTDKVCYSIVCEACDRLGHKTEDCWLCKYCNRNGHRTEDCFAARNKQMMLKKVAEGKRKPVPIEPNNEILIGSQKPVFPRVYNPHTVEDDVEVTSTPVVQTALPPFVSFQHEKK